MSRGRGLSFFSAPFPLGPRGVPSERTLARSRQDRLASARVTREQGATSPVQERFTQELRSGPRHSSVSWCPSPFSEHLELVPVCAIRATAPGPSVSSVTPVGTSCHVTCSRNPPPVCSPASAGPQARPGPFPDRVPLP